MNTAEIIAMKCIIVLVINQLGLFIADELEGHNMPIIAYVTGFVNAAMIFSVKFEALLASIIPG